MIKYVEKKSYFSVMDEMKDFKPEILLLLLLCFTSTANVSAIANNNVGVKTGDWIKYDYKETGFGIGGAPRWMKVEFLRVEGTTITVRLTLQWPDGRESSQTEVVDIVAVGTLTLPWAFLFFFIFVIPANSATGNSIYMSGYGNVTITDETTRTYAGAGRTVVYTNFSLLTHLGVAQLTYYWDKQTGILVEVSAILESATQTAKAMETNMWQAGPFGLPIDPTLFYILIISVAVVTAVGATTLVRRRKSLQLPTSSTYSTSNSSTTPLKRTFFTM